MLHAKGSYDSIRVGAQATHLQTLFHTEGKMYLAECGAARAKHLLGFLLRVWYGGWLPKARGEQQRFADGCRRLVGIHLLTVSTSRDRQKHGHRMQILHIRLGLEIRRQSLTVNETIASDDTRGRALGEHVQQSGLRENPEDKFAEKCTQERSGTHLSSAGFTHKCCQLPRSDISRDIIQQLTASSMHGDDVVQMMPSEDVCHRRCSGGQRGLVLRDRSLTSLRIRFGPGLFDV